MCAIRVGPLRNVRVEGASDERMRSLDRQRHALTAKVAFTYADSFWHDNGQNGDAYFEAAVIGGTWVQRVGLRLHGGRGADRPGARQQQL